MYRIGEYVCVWLWEIVGIVQMGTKMTHVRVRLGVSHRDCRRHDW